MLNSIVDSAPIFIKEVGPEPKGFIFISSSFPEHLTLGDTPSSCPEHSTLGDVKSSINVRVRVRFSFGFFFTFRLCSYFTVYSETIYYVSNIYKVEK